MKNRPSFQKYLHYVSYLMMLESPKVNDDEKREVMKGLKLEEEEPDSLDLFRTLLLFFTQNILQLPIWAIKTSVILGRCHVPGVLPFTSFYTSLKMLVLEGGVSKLFLVFYFVF